MYSKNPVMIANDFNQFFEHSTGKTTARTATQLAISHSEVDERTGDEC
jgi:hypothetical protein